jgi:hypothetical protein
MFGVKDGFNVVIGNPPYISHDKLTNGDYYKSQYKDVWSPFADIYCYFFKQGLLLLRTNGILAYITSNSYIKADYGLPLRKLLGSYNTLYALINMELSQVFSEAIVNTAIAVIIKGKTSPEQKVVVSNSVWNGGTLIDYIKERSFTLPVSRFVNENWVLESEHYLCILDKMMDAGCSLHKHGAKIRLGIATGDNKAFILDEDERNRFIGLNLKNKDILKPILRGRDILRYVYKQPYEYVILSKNGINLPKDYPDLAKHLEGFGESFKKRGAKGQYWWNLRACDFYDDFKKEKIVWIELTDKGRFALCKDEIYCINSAYFMIPPSRFDSRFLIAILNSKLIEFFVKKFAETSGMGTTRWINNIVSTIPIPAINLSQQKTFVKFIEKILAAKAKDARADTAGLEAELDKMVYAVYGLTEDEVRVIEPGFPLSEAEYEGIDVEERQ